MSWHVEQALARVDGLTEAKEYEIADCRDGKNWVARIRGIGTPERFGFVTADGVRIYRLPSGLFEVRVGDDQELIRVEGNRVIQLDQSEALQWLTQHAA